MCRGAIKNRAGYAPFRVLAKLGLIPLDSAVITAAGKLPLEAIIHVAGINMAWRSLGRSIRDSTRKAIGRVAGRGFHTIVLPLMVLGQGWCLSGSPCQLLFDSMELAIQRIDFVYKKILARY